MTSCIAWPAPTSAASAASTVVEKAAELTGKGDSGEPKSTNGKGSAENVDSLLETGNSSSKSTASTLTDPPPGETAPALGASPSP